MDPAARARDVLDRCAALGFALAGVCAAEPSRRAQEVRDWIDSGQHAEMAWLAEQIDDRLDPRRLLEGASSVLMVADLHAADDDPPLPPARGRIARYCRGRDYHDVIKRRLHDLADDLRAAHPGERFRSFVDTAPVLERELAERCGLGWIGKHTLLINPARGSWLLLGGFVTTMDLVPPPEQQTHADHCGTCTRCIDACPTHAIAPYRVDATRCISYLTIEHASPIEPALGSRLAEWLIGCDICQEVCPHNRGTTPPTRDDYAPRRDSFDLLEVLNWSERSRRRAFGTSAMKRVTLEQVKRNALWCTADSLDDPEHEPLLARVIEMAEDPAEHPLVRDTARAVLEQRSEPTL